MLLFSSEVFVFSGLQLLQWNMDTNKNMNILILLIDKHSTFDFKKISNWTDVFIGFCHSSYKSKYEYSSKIPTNRQQQ